MDPASVIITAIAGLGSSIADAIGTSKVKQTAQINQRTVFADTIGDLRLANTRQETYTRVALIIAFTLIIIVILRLKS